jgi:hypothetical protein
MEEFGANRSGLLVETIAIPIAAAPEEVFGFLADYARHYREISPDHIERLVDVRDPSFDHPDVRFYFRQRSPVTGRIQKVRGRLVAVEENRRLDTRFLFPASLFLFRVDNVIEPGAGGCVLKVSLHFTPLAKLAKRARQRVVRHISSELQESKRIIEAAGAA